MQTPKSAKQLRRCRGIIVWDLDGVLFDIKKFRKEYLFLFKRYGISAGAVRRVRGAILRRRLLFSVATVVSYLRRYGFRIPLRKFRKEFYHIVESQNYLAKDADKVLHGLKKRGFCHMILSFGSAPLQYRKINLGCGVGFRRHFRKILVTRGDKYRLLRKLGVRHRGIPVFFIDDTQDHIVLVRRHVPAVRTIFYTKSKSLEDVKEVVLGTRIR